VNAKKHPEMLEEIESFLKQHPDLDQVEVLCTDLAGNFFGKRYPIEQLRKFAVDGLAMARAMYVLSVTSASLDELAEFGIDDGDPDIEVSLVPGSLSVVNWGNRPRAQILLTTGPGDPLVDPRQALARIVALCAERELRPVAAFELEFTLFDYERAENGGVQPVINPKSGEVDVPVMLGSERLDGFENVIDEIISNCESQGISTGAICAEYGLGQYEINFSHYDDLLRAADHAQLYKRTVRAVARKHGMRASFMAKPALDCAGNGQHIHISVLDKDGRNIFDGGDTPSDPLMHAIAGLQRAARECMLFWAPSVNSYRRFEPENSVPMGATWAHENRYVAFRIPLAKSGAWRIENRISGADANCYLSLAATLSGLLHGLDNPDNPGEETAGAPEKADGTLPLSIRTAIEATRSGDILNRYFGTDFIALYCNHREGELHEFERHISSRELDWYL
jgi:glutamine synthetase